MTPNKVTVQTLFEGEKQFLIPLFQRHYVWDAKEQWNPLWEDIVGKTNRRIASPQGTQPHFTGALVTQQKGTSASAIPAYEIIDGQQRLTTFQIILCAFRDVCREQAADDFMAAADDAEKLVINTSNRAKRSASRHKLVPTQFDRPAMAFIIDQTDEREVGRLTNAYNYFRAQIKGFVGNDGEKADTLLRAVCDDFGFVEIRIDGDDEPEMIFESLNARGKPLLQFDLLRNYLFLRTRQFEDRDDLYKKYWAHFESSQWDSGVKVGRSLISFSELFLQHFLTAKLATEKLPNLFAAYREQYSRQLPEECQTQYELQEFHRYSQIYLSLATRGDDSAVKRAMLVYHDLGITTLRPFFLYLLAETGMSEKQRNHVFHALESFTVRRALCARNGHKDFNKFFPALIKQLREEVFSVQKFLTRLERQTAESRRWPQGSDVQYAFNGMWRPTGVDRGVIRYVLYRIECYLRKENPRAENVALNFSGLTLEHVLPESWHGTWHLPLADGGVLFNDLYTEEYRNNNWDWRNTIAPEHLVDESHAEVLEHAKSRMGAVQNIGNLTLLTQPLNSSGGNTPFEQKKRGMGENSLLLLNKQICDEDDWDVTQIKAREARLYDIFCKIWPNAQWFLDNIPSE